MSLTKGFDGVYTALLGVLGFFMLLSMGVVLYVMRQDPRPGEEVVMLVPAGFYFMYGIACSIVAVGRRFKLVYARWGTAIVSYALAAVIPLGTAMFLYWLFHVRKKEMLSNENVRSLEGVISPSLPQDEVDH